VVHSADIQDRDGAKLVFGQAATLFPGLKLVWADGGYAGKLIEWLKRWCGWVLEIVRKISGQTGFEVLPRRWVVERTFAWLGHYRRLSKDYEELLENSEAYIHIAMIQLMLHRLHRKPSPQNRDSV
jgi:putative transposase